MNLLFEMITSQGRTIKEHMNLIAKSGLAEQKKSLLLK